MIWYLGLFISALISFVLALRSMRDFQDQPSAAKSDYGLFLIKHPHQLSPELFEYLVDQLGRSIGSIEHIQKGDSQVLTAYLPKKIAANFPVLGLIEIEDYVEGKNSSETDLYIRSRQISINDSHASVIELKKKGLPLLQNGLKFDLHSDQYFCLQAVFQKTKNGVQLTLRTLIKETDPQKRVDFIKNLRQFLPQHSSLIMSTQTLHSPVYDEYKKRALVPSQVQSFTVPKEELLKFLQS